MATNQTAFDAIVSRIQNNQITNVYFYQAGITDADCVPLANALKNSTSVTSLNLKSNSIGFGGASSLASALQVNTALTSLDLGSNSLIGNDGASSLASALQVNTALTSLDLSGTSIGFGGASSLASALQVNTKLRSFVFNGNSIGASGAISLASALRVNTALKFLDLRSNFIGSSGAISLASALQVNTALQLLSLASNSIGDSGASSFASALQVNRVLSTLYLNSNAIGDSGASDLLQALTHNYKLTTLGLDSNSNSTQINALLDRNSQCAGGDLTLPILDCPFFKFNSFSIQNGERLTVTPADLYITLVYDVNIPLNGNFSISNITHCQFLNAQSQPITTFSQTAINNGAISLQHDGSGIAPSFNITASYNDFETWPIPAAVNFTLVPFTSSMTQTTTSTSTTPFTSSSSSSRVTTATPLPLTFTPTTTPFTSSSSSSRVTTTTPLPFTSTSRPSTTAVAANSAGASGANVGGIIGGAVAGAAVVGVGIFLLSRYRRKKSTHIGVLPTNTFPMIQNFAYSGAGAAPTPHATSEQAARERLDSQGYQITDQPHSLGGYEEFEPYFLGSYEQFAFKNPAHPAAAAAAAADPHQWNSQTYTTGQKALMRTPTKRDPTQWDPTQWNPTQYDVASRTRHPYDPTYDTLDDEIV